MLKKVKKMNYEIKSFQELTNNELYQILKARVDVFVVEQKCPYPELDTFDQGAMHYYLKNGQDIVANVRILPGGTRYGEASIGRVLVTQGYRKQGYARAIMNNAIKYIQEEWNESRIKIQAQVYLEKFYQSLGFKRVSNEYLEDDIPHVDMIWEGK